MGLTFAVPDLHGRFDVLEAALGQIEGRSETGHVVFLGDYVDRGPDSRRIIERLIAGPPTGWRWTCLQGNHEHMMLKALIEHRPVPWLNNGGGQTLLSYGHPREGMLDYGVVPPEHVGWLRALPLYHEDDHRVFVHAGVDPAVPMPLQQPRVLQYKVYSEVDRSGYRGKHLVHGHRVAQSVTIFARTALDLYASTRERLLVAVFDDAIAGGPLELMTISIHEDARRQVA